MSEAGLMVPIRGTELAVILFVLRSGAPTELFQVRVAGGVRAPRTHYVPSRDGRRFLINTPTGDPAMVPITVVLNWTAALKK